MVKKSVVSIKHKMTESTSNQFKHFLFPISIRILYSNVNQIMCIEHESFDVQHLFLFICELCDGTWNTRNTIRAHNIFVKFNSKLNVCHLKCLEMAIQIQWNNSNNSLPLSLSYNNNFILFCLSIVIKTD